MAVGDLMRLIAHNAPELPKDCEWINTARPLLLSKLSGNIVILDFWTYCCINCVHMIHVLSKIEKKYKDYPVVIIGVHSAKFKNENNSKNISEAISRYGIQHPVVSDKEMHAWALFGVNAWPTMVIIGPTGRIEYKIAGELSFEQLDQLLSGIIHDAKSAGTLAKHKSSIFIRSQSHQSLLSYPGKISFSKDGSRFALSDSNHNRILIVNSRNGKILDSIGNRDCGLDDGRFNEVSFSRPQGILWHNDSVYVADTGNHAIRRISLTDRHVDTIAGTGLMGSYAEYGLSYPACSIQLNSPWDLATDGRTIFIAMAGLHQIWSYSIMEGLISPFAGSGIENIGDGPLEYAEFAQPSGLWLQENTLYVADSEVSGVRFISLSKGLVGTIVGRGLFTFGDRTGSISDALLQHPIGITGCKSTLYVADTYNNSIKAIDLKKNSICDVISGNGKESMCRINAPRCDTLPLFEPNDVKIFSNILYITDTNNHIVRCFDLKERCMKTFKMSE